MRRPSFRHSAAANARSVVSLVQVVSRPRAATAPAKVGVVPVRHGPIDCETAPIRITLDPLASALGTTTTTTASNARAQLLRRYIAASSRQRLCMSFVTRNRQSRGGSAYPLFVSPTAPAPLAGLGPVAPPDVDV